MTPSNDPWEAYLDVKDHGKMVLSPCNNNKDVLALLKRLYIEKNVTVRNDPKYKDAYYPTVDFTKRKV
jgi:hypothetical protein